MPAADGFASYAGDGDVVAPQYRRGVHRPAGLVRLLRKLWPAELRFQESRRAQQAYSRVHARSALRCRPDNGLGRPGHRRTVTPSLGRRRYARLPTDWTATMRHSTRLHSQLTRSLRRMQFAALPSGDYSLPLRSPGSQRTGAYFSVAPFIGAVFAVALGEPVTWPLLVAGALMPLGVWLHLTEQHAHVHTHEPLTHEHWHVHDEHHQHNHDFPVAPGTRHRHPHSHAPITHSHVHFPDVHHRHRHS